MAHTTCSTVCLPQDPVAAPVLVASSPLTMTESSASQRATTWFPVCWPVPWSSFLAVHANGDETRPLPWPSFRISYSRESPSDAAMKPSWRCTFDCSPSTTIGDVIEFQVSGYNGNLCTSTSCITIHDMCSASELRCWNGVPACARKDLLQKIRNEWGFQGYIVSDCDAVGIIREYQSYTTSDEDSVAIVLKAGMDINCGSFLVLRTKRALEKGKIQEEDINRALFNLFSVQLRLGLFDKASGNQWFTQLGPSNICTKEHRELAAEAVRQGTVLLKNDNSFLPLKRSEVSHIAIIGPAATDAYIMGNFNNLSSSRSAVTVCLSYPQELDRYFSSSQLKKLQILNLMRRLDVSYDPFENQFTSCFPGFSVTGGQMQDTVACSTLHQFLFGFSPSFHPVVMLELQLARTGSHSVYVQKLQMDRRGIEGATLNGISINRNPCQPKWTESILTFPAHVALYCSSFASASEGIFYERKLELSNWVAYMVEQYTDMRSSRTKPDLHFLCISTSTSLKQNRYVVYALLLIGQSAALKYMDLCWFTTAILTEVFSAWFSLEMGVSCSAQPNLLLPHAYHLTCDTSEGSCCCVLISLNLHSTISLADYSSLGLGAHQAVFWKSGPELPLHLGLTSSTAVHQSGYEALYNKQAQELATDIYLMGPVREENSETWLVVCNRHSTLDCSHTWGVSCVTPCLASGAIDKLDSSYLTVLGKELHAPWDPGGHAPRVSGDSGLRASRMLRRGECHGPCGVAVLGCMGRGKKWAAGPRHDGRTRELLYLKEMRATGRGVENQNLDRMDPGKGGLLFLPPSSLSPSSLC